MFQASSKSYSEYPIKGYGASLCQRVLQLITSLPDLEHNDLCSGPVSVRTSSYATTSSANVNSRWTIFFQRTNWIVSRQVAPTSANAKIFFAVSGSHLHQHKIIFGNFGCHKSDRIIPSAGSNRLRFHELHTVLGYTRQIPSHMCVIIQYSKCNTTIESFAFFRRECTLHNI